MLHFLPVFILLFPADLWAAQSETIDLFFSGLRMFIGMIIVVGLMLLIYVLNRKGIKFLKGSKTGHIKILEMRPVGGKKILCLVEVRGEEILLGLGNERVDFLYHFDSHRSNISFEDNLKEHFETKK